MTKQDRPVNYVMWDQAEAFCAWKASHTALPWRLCIEAEWEKAARGGCEKTDCNPGDDACCRPAMPTFPWGSQAPSCDSPALAVFREEGYAGCGTGTVWPVGSMPAGASPYGALDMAGNVREWVQDCFHEDYIDAPADGSAREDEPCPLFGARAVRGGSFDFESYAMRASFRMPGEPGVMPPDVGIRCCRSLP